MPVWQPLPFFILCWYCFLPMLSFVLAAGYPELSKTRAKPIHEPFVIIFLLLSLPTQSKLQAFWKYLFVCFTVFSFE